MLEGLRGRVEDIDISCQEEGTEASPKWAASLKISYTQPEAERGKRNSKAGEVFTTAEERLKKQGRL